jgi:hypothetical protein
MPQSAILWARALPETPLDAAAKFHQALVPAIRADSAADVVIGFEPAGDAHAHAGWRLAAVQSLARELAPRRVNGVVGYERPDLAATAAFLHESPGITGQILHVAGNPTKTV